MRKFIYVFDKNAADTLSEAGFQLLKSDAGHNVYVFENLPTVTVCFSNLDFVYSDTLTF